MKHQPASKNFFIKARPVSRQTVVAPSRQLARVAAAAPKALVSDVRELILAARESVALTVNAGLVTLYWEIGRRVHQDILKEKRAEYGGRIVSALGTQLVVGKRQEHVELLQMERDGIHVASYVTKAIPKRQLEQKLQRAVRLARARLEGGRRL